MITVQFNIWQPGSNQPSLCIFTSPQSIRALFEAIAHEGDTQDDQLYYISSGDKTLHIYAPTGPVLQDEEL